MESKYSATPNKKSVLIRLILTISLLAFLAGTGEVASRVFSMDPGVLIAKLQRLCVYLIPFPIVLLLSYKFPVQENQKLFSAALMQDAIYFFTKIAYRIFLGIYLVSFLGYIYINYLSFLTITAVESWPMTVRVVMSVLFGDFMSWLHHVVRHKVPLFWKFHMIHHSQREMNFFTDLRVHIGDSIIARFISFIPIFMLQSPPLTALYWAILLQWPTMIYHSNLKTNYGILRYILVTPQSHRIHHSIRPEHQDLNFGVMFSIWDYLFGTQYRKYDEYPEAGISDEAFPMERDVKHVGLLVTYFAQFMYPFRLILQRG